MQEAQTWRELLGTIIQDIQERQRIANELGINPATLTRWVNNETNPRMQNLQHMLRVLPAEYQRVMRESLAAELPAFSHLLKDAQSDDSSQEIPSPFYTSVIDAYKTSPRMQLFWSISNLILQQALAQLDSNQLGMEITIAQCMPPKEDGKVRSLRERAGRGKPPWNTNIEQRSMFLGIESLAGYAATTLRLVVIQDRAERQVLFPGRWVEKEESGVACPIMHEDRIAGCLLVSSTQPHYFVPFRQRLIQNYADLMALAFEPGEFYSGQDMKLQVMPPSHVQDSRFSELRQRISDVMLQAFRDHHPLSILQAEQIVWQQLEDELLQLPYQEE